MNLQLLNLLNLVNEGSLKIKKSIVNSSKNFEFQKLAHSLRTMLTIVETMTFLTSFGDRLAHSKT